MKVNIIQSIDEEKLIKERQELLSKYPEYSCDDALMELDENKHLGKEIKFPVFCKTCWKVLVFNLNINEAKELSNKYKLSKYLPQKTNLQNRIINYTGYNSLHEYLENNDKLKYLLVIYTNSKNMRDKVKNEILKNTKTKGRIRYRFACNSIQEEFPEMFISSGTPNPKYL